MTSPSFDIASPLLALSHNLAAAVEHAGETVVAVNGRRRMASSGIHWQSGIIVTAEHTLRRDEEITVTLAGDRTLPVTLVGRDAGTDLAVLRLQSAEATLPTAKTTDTTGLKVGHLVMALARAPESGLSASLGVISSLSGSWRTWHGGQIDQFIRPAVTVYPGFSGGALIDPQGQVIGLNTAGPRSLALTIPAVTINRVVEQLLQRGRIARGYLGLGMQSVQLPDSLQRSLNLGQAGGVIVVSVEVGSPADQAGVLMGDVLVTFGNTPVNDVGDVHAMLTPEQVGTPLTAQVIRGGVLQEVTILVGERPQREV